MSTSDKQLTIGGVLLVLLIFLGVPVVKVFHDASKAADYSAHAALTAEICYRLETNPSGQPYPSSLSELRLTYPDGGNASLLSRFTYRSTGTNCSVRTVLHGQEVVRSFP